MFPLLAGMLAAPMLLAQARPAQAQSLIHDLPRTFEALYDLTGGAGILPTSSIELEAQSRVENGPRWQVRIVSRLRSVSWMAVVIEQNPQPLAAWVRFRNGALPEITSHFKIADSSQIIIVAESGGKFYGLRRFITVVGHCL